MDKALELADWGGFPERASARSAKAGCGAFGIATFLEASAAGLAPRQAFGASTRRHPP